MSISSQSQTSKVWAFLWTFPVELSISPGLCVSPTVKLIVTVTPWQHHPTAGTKWVTGRSNLREKMLQSHCFYPKFWKVSVAVISLLFLIINKYFSVYCSLGQFLKTQVLGGLGHYCPVLKTCDLSSCRFHQRLTNRHGTEDI